MCPKEGGKRHLPIIVREMEGIGNLAGGKDSLRVCKKRCSRRGKKGGRMSTFSMVEEKSEVKPGALNGPQNAPILRNVGEDGKTRVVKPGGVKSNPLCEE